MGFKNPVWTGTRCFLVGCVGLTGTSYGQVRAFGEAEGFGRFAAGARTNLAAASVYHVTNLNNSGAGSFRDAVSQPNRFVVFDVSGVAQITSVIQVQDNVTIAGQTAPGGGFTLYGNKLGYTGADNSITRHLRIRKGHVGVDDAVSIARGSNMMFDHMSITWGNDETFSMNPDSGYTIDNISIQNSIIGQGLDNDNHSAGGLMTIGQGKFSVLRSLFIDNETRNPKVRGNNQYVNNVVYNWTTAAYIMGDTGNQESNANVEGNYFIEGPNNGGSPFSSGNSVFHIYQRDNWIDADKDGVLDGTLIGPGGYPGSDVVGTPHNFPKVGMDSAQTALARVIAQVGPSLYRDEVDTRLIQELSSYGTLGQIVVREPDLYPAYPGALPSPPRPTDTDNDGIPDTWETANGLNPNNATDWKNLSLRGYTMLEEYFNGLASFHADKIWTAASGTWPTNGNWSGGTPIWDDDAFVRGNGAGASGNLTISAAGATAMTLNIGGNGMAAGETVTVNSGGSLWVLDTLYVGAANRGTMTVNGGGSVDAYTTVLGNTIGNHIGTLAINGGTFKTSRIAAATAGSGVTLAGGGTITAVGDLLIAAPIALGAGGGTVDTAGFSGSITGVISGNGPLTKIGIGALDLTGTNTFTGAVNLVSGDLGVSSDANLGNAANAMNFTGGTLKINGTTLNNLNAHVVNWSTFNGGFNIATTANTFTVSQSIGGGGSVSKSGTGTLVLGGANTYTGGTNLIDGILSIGADNNLGAANSPINFAGGTLRITGTTFTNLAGHTPTFSPFVSTIDVNNAANTFTIPQVIGGAAGLSKAGPGVLILSALNSHTGDTNITGGTLRIGNALALRKSTVNLNTAGVTLDLNGFNATLGGLSGNRGLDLKGTTLYVGTNTETYSGVISSSIGAGSVVKNGNGVWTVSGLSTYTGSTTVSAGTLALSSLTNGGAPSTLGASSTSPANLVLDGGTLQFMANGATNRGFTLTPNGGTLLAVGTTFIFTGDVLASGAGDRTLTADLDINSSELGGDIKDTTDVGGGKTSFVKTGAGRLFFNTTSKTYSGDTSVQEGTLLLYKIDVMPFGIGKGNLAISTGATADSRYNMNVNALTGAGILTNNDGNNTRTFTLGNGNAGGTFSGVIGARINIVKTGTGTQIFSGANTYTGTTTVNQGVLQFNTAASIGGTGASVIPVTGGASAAGYAMDQAFLARHAPGSTGAIALAINSGNNLNFATPALANASLGATGNFTYSGLLTPAANGYRLGGAAGTLTVSAANALSGAANNTIVAGGKVSINNVNNYTGSTTVAGFLVANLISNGGVGSSLGQSTAAAANLVLDGGTIQYTGGGTSTDRLFTLTLNGGTIDASGGGGIGFAATGLIGQQGNGNRTLTFTGANGSTGNNWNFAIGDPSSGVTSVVKSGNGRWFAGNAASTYSGDTTISSGDLYTAIANALPFGPGRGNLVLNAGRFYMFTGGQNINALNGTG
ncbi:MAG: autotransporter-associated beta strand repeat-containing protein, partial [Burkholderiales bacterium]|nr:autotransporter-associated beta strand repeat-containing protein [Phycisphaerae bacterium]